MPRLVKILLNPISYFLLSAIFLSACSGKSDNNKGVIKAMEESLQKSNISINASSTQISNSLKNKMQNPSTQYKANFWQPKAQQIQTLSTEIYNYLGGLKAEGKVSTEKATTLYHKLYQYKEKVLAIDESLKTEFNKRIILITRVFDSTGFKEKEFVKTFFNNVSAMEASAILTKFQNNIKVIENTALVFCYEQVPSYEHYYNYFSAIVGQNSSYIKGGGEVKITAGIGAFTTKVNSYIKVNGREIAFGEQGFAEYEFKAPKKAGNYSVPVEITYLNQFTGKYEARKINVEYTVAKECDQ
jgi:hypothetical protein